MIGTFGGASRSLCEAIGAFPPGEVEAFFVTQDGTVSKFFSNLGTVIGSWGLTQFDNTRYGYYRGWRWLILLRELLYLPLTVMALVKARRLIGKVDLIHLNEFTGLVPLWIAKKIFNAPAVVHVRSVSSDRARSWRTRFINWMLARHANAIIAIDENVRSSLPGTLSVNVIHNAFSARSSGRGDDEILSKFSKLRKESFKVGFVGNLLRVKGILEFIEAARVIRDKNLDIEFVVVGGDLRPAQGFKVKLLNIFGLAQDVRTEVKMLLDSYGLNDRVHFFGFAENLNQVYPGMDVLCFPSHYDAPGRPIFEAAFYGKPSIVAVRNPMPDTLVPGETGLAIEPRSVAQLVEAIELLFRDRQLTVRMGKAAQEMARRNFDPQQNAVKLLSIYRRLAA